MGHEHRSTDSRAARAALCFGALFATAVAAWAQGDGSTSRVSLGNGGVQGDQDSRNGMLSADGRYVAFQSMATNLVSVPTSSTYDVYVYDLWTREAVLVSAALGGAAPDGASVVPAWSRDGRWICFSSSASNLVAGDTNDEFDVFVYDVTTGALTRESVASDGAQANGMNGLGRLSADGRFLVFDSLATELVPGDTNGLNDVFLRDRVGGTTVRVSVGALGQEGNGDSSIGGAAISDDASKVTFESWSDNWIPGDDNGTIDVFVVDVASGALTCASSAAFGVAGNGGASDAGLSNDGRYVVFQSWASNLIPGDTNGAADVFRRDLQTGDLVLLSRSLGGAPANGTSGHPTSSADGMRVAFESAASNLVAGDTNGLTDVFLYELASDSTVRVSVSTFGAEANQFAELPQLSPDGRYVAFHTRASNLISNDDNARFDVFLRDTHAPNVVAYCTAKVNSQGCAATIGSIGAPSLSDPAPFEVRASDVLNQKNGLLLYGFAADASPFQGGWLCVDAPIRRTGVQRSGGNPPPADCSGVFGLDFNAYMQAKGYPEFTPGVDVYAQYWYRDPADPFQSSLTDALAFAPAP